MVILAGARNLHCGDALARQAVHPVVERALPLGALDRLQSVCFRGNVEQGAKL